jgi:phosphoribosyl-AMP cyclohydrolase
MKVFMPNFDKRSVVVTGKDGEYRIDGLVTVITQDYNSREVLMVAYTDKAGYLETLRTGIATYYSTSRKKRWVKGEASGNYQEVKSILIDCDGDAVIYVVRQMGGTACHTGSRSCFYRNHFSQISVAFKAGEEEELALVDIDNVHPRLA